MAPQSESLLDQKNGWSFRRWRHRGRICWLTEAEFSVDGATEGENVGFNEVSSVIIDTSVDVDDVPVGRRICWFRHRRFQCCWGFRGCRFLIICCRIRCGRKNLAVLPSGPNRLLHKWPCCIT